MIKVISNESVFDGHPDKVCDRISDEILDNILKEDIDARVAVEIAIKNNIEYIFDKVTTTAIVDYNLIVQKILFELGYLKTFKVIENISVQSPDIALVVD